MITGSTMMITLIVFVFVIEAFAIAGSNIEHVNADSGTEKKKCNDHEHNSAPSSKCSNKDTTPFILPFP